MPKSPLIVYEKFFDQEKQKFIIRQKNELPRVIHFVWAGGEKQMPSENIERVINWAKKHREKDPKFKIYIWVDYRTAKGTTDKEKECSVIEHFDKIDGFSEAGIGLKDVRRDLFNEYNYKNEIVYKIFNYQINNLRPNYGLSSDLLRYSILYRFGGAYFDSDIACGSRLDEKINFNEQENCCLWIEGNSQQQEVIGNDAFVTTKGNPIIRKLLDKSIEHCIDPKKIYDEIGGTPFKFFPDNCDSYEYITATTPWLTGPRMVGEVISGDVDDLYLGKKQKKFEERKFKQEDLIGEIKQLPIECRDIEKNEGQWTALPLKKLGGDPNQVLLNIVEFTAFELINMHLWRLNDIFYNYYEATGECLDLDKYITNLKQSLVKQGYNLSNILQQQGIAIQELKSLAECKEDGLKKYTESVKQILKKHAKKITDEKGQIQYEDVIMVSIEDGPLATLNNRVNSINAQHSMLPQEYWSFKEIKPITVEEAEKRTQIEYTEIAERRKTINTTKRST